MDTMQFSLFGNPAGNAAPCALPQGRNYRLTTDRPLARSWRGRAADNVAAILLANRIIAEGRQATPDEQDRLIRFTGFGATDLAQSLFPVQPGKYPDGWADLGLSLAGAVTERDWRELANATQYAHFTPEYITRAVWAGALRLGFAGGTVLEPGVGAGMFIALAPEAIYPATTFVGVERDPVTARIAGLLYPDATIRRGDFRDLALPLPGGPYDMAIGNPPFSDTRIQDGPIKLALHEFFIVRALRTLKPGGIGAFVCSRYLMDGVDPSARAKIAELADLIGAVRLPEGAMRASAGTDVVADLLFLRRREDNAKGRFGELWLDLAVVPGSFGAKQVTVNRYYADHPAMALGLHGVASSRFGLAYTCRVAPAQASRLPDNLMAAIAALPACSPAKSPAKAKAKPAPDAEIDLSHVTVREGCFFVAPNGAIGQVRHGRPALLPMRGPGVQGLTKPAARIIAALIPVRDAARAVLECQSQDRPWDEPQAALRTAYQRFVANFGPINRTEITTRMIKHTVEDFDEITGEKSAREVEEERLTYRRPNLAPFADDPDSPLVASVENYDDDTREATMGAICTDRVVRAPRERQIESAADALAVVLDTHGCVDMERIAELRGASRDAVIEELGDTVYRDPETGAWETADQYLSGPVRTKLAVAEATAVLDVSFQRNVDALRLVQPADLLPSDVSCRLGAPWVPVSMIKAFAEQVLRVKAPVIKHVPEATMWSVEQYSFRASTHFAGTYGTHRRHHGKILEDALNSRIPRIYDTAYDDNGKKIQVFNASETEAAKDKLAKMKARFADWVWEDAIRARALVNIYNTRFNNLVPRHFDGRHLTLPGLSNVLSPYDIQKRVIWRVVAAGSTYIAHAVGAGKTLDIICAVMEQRRLGLVNKPMIVVPAHTLAQFSREFVQSYPNCRILIADESNFEKERRTSFLARAATDDWDAIVITHPAFRFIAPPPDFERSMIEDQIASYETMMTLMTADREAKEESRMARKRLENLKEKLEQRLQSLKTPKDDFLSIREIGIDQVIVDEAQEFRKLSFPTNNTSLKGIDPDGSKRAWDLYVKACWIETINPKRHLILAGGTPIVNTMGEMHTLLRYMNPDALESRGVMGFDAWAATFGDTVTNLELQPSGFYKPVTRFAQFVNIPELTSMFREVADYVDEDQLQGIVKLPRIRTGQRQIITAEASDTFRRGQKWLGRRIKAIESRGGRPQPGDDIILSVINDGRHLAIDSRLIDPRYPNEPGSKLNLMVDNVFRIWQETADQRYTHPISGQPYLLPGAAQLIFSDLGTLSIETKRGFSAYRWIKDTLVARGVPEREVVFIQDYHRAVDKQRLFAEVNAGRVRIVIGSTQKMGTGVNMQVRLVALHHLDVPWVPSWIAQREGRIVRQGNQNDEVSLFAYATLTSMDAPMWQTNERKARFIRLALGGDTSIRVAEDLGADQADQFAMAKAIASGDDRLMQLAGLTAEVRRLQRLKSSHFNEQYTVRAEIEYATRSIEACEALIPHVKADLAKRVATRGELFVANIGGSIITDRVAAGNIIASKIITAQREQRAGTWTLAQLGGFDIKLIGTHERLTFDTDRRDPGSYQVVLVVDRSDKPHHVAYAGDNPLGLIRRLENHIDQIDHELTDLEYRLQNAQSRLAGRQSQLGAAFQFDTEYAAKLAELQALEDELAKSGITLDDNEAA